MKIEQFFDKGLAHLSYAIISENEMAVIDPARDPAPYFAFAKAQGAGITSVIETHPHADFVSSHKEIAENGATIYVGKMVGVAYPHVPVNDGDFIKVGKAALKVLHTPGHSPDSISLLLMDEAGNEHAVFTGDTLFIGDVGRPDLREASGNMKVEREILARQLYHSLHNKLLKLPDSTIVYPAHGPGSLCGKAMSAELSSTMGQQKIENYALQPMEEEQFVKMLLENQPYVPKYFSYNVELNRLGADSFGKSIANVKKCNSEGEFQPAVLIIDTRPAGEFKAGHLKNAINIPHGGKFETWLGSIVSPDESFYLVANSDAELNEILKKSAKIGYESKIAGTLVKSSFRDKTENILDTEQFRADTSLYTVLDVRENGEVKSLKIFKDSIHIPLPELRERIEEIPQNKPVVVHCAGGYRSAVASSILSSAVAVPVFDLGEAIKEFQQKS